MQSVTAIVISWNASELIEKCLEAIKEYGANIISEIVVIDNASQDNTVDKIKTKFPDVKIICNEKNLGFAEAANQGIDISSSEYLLFVNTDAFLLEGCVEKLFDFISKNDKIAIAAPRLFRHNGSVQKSATYYPTFFTEFFKSFFQVWINIKELFYSIKKGYSAGTIRGACFIARKSVLEKIGKFDESYFFFLEETDLCYRLKSAGWKIVYLPGAGVIHLSGASVKKANFDGRKQYYTSILKFSRKHYSSFHGKLLEIFLRCFNKI
ncbi:MAG: hypothetical protein CVU80_01005 [Elusimicrobia bacterium HGW-Elusimicrobia-4]|nr:MAG: hypothetical protein CVU80_01005 [Elusimicrobia bacterium HGW-Elusimicrobia-4]